MSVETPNVAEEAPVTKQVPSTQEPEVTPPKATENPAVAEATVAAAVTSDDAAPAPATENPTAEGNTVVGAVPATEGVLGYKEHGFLKSFRYSKHFFWFGEEVSTSESLAHYVKSEKGEHAHHVAAWAQETGKGVLFYAKRAEDKAHPSGVIVLADASTVTKEGTTEFSFTVNKVHHRFQANTSTERDSWIVALEKNAEEARAAKEEITSRESYKKTIEGFAVAAPTAAAAGSVRSTSKGPKKSLDAATATAAASSEPTPAAAPVANAETASTTSSDADKKAKKEVKDAAKKERSQSRKRTSIFGMLGKKEEDKEVKKDEKDEKKAQKEAEKEVKKAEKEHVKEEKKVEAEQKKEEAKATHDSNKAVEAAEAAAVAAAPAAAIVAVEKREEKKEEETTTPTEKKNKRASVFGSLFGKKNVTSPAVEKTEKDAAAPVVAAADKESEVPPVSETAPKLDEPIENKPIDTAEVTAPVDTVETPAATETAPVLGEEPAKDAAVAPAAEQVSTPKNEKKGGFLGFMKKAEAKKEEKKEEAAEEKAAEQAAKDPVAAAATTDSATDATTETPVEAKEERPAREKRRSSFFGALGTIKKKNPETAEAEGTTPEIKREKSPLPAKLGGMFRKPSKAVKPTETAAEPEATKTEGAATEGVEAGNTTVVEPTDSKIVGDVVPDELHTTVHDAVTTSNSEVQASA